MPLKMFSLVPFISPTRHSLKDTEEPPLTPLERVISVNKLSIWKAK